MWLQYGGNFTILWNIFTVLWKLIPWWIILSTYCYNGVAKNAKAGDVLVIYIFLFVIQPAFISRTPPTSRRRTTNHEVTVMKKSEVEEISPFNMNIIYIRCERIVALSLVVSPCRERCSLTKIRFRLGEGGERLGSAELCPTSRSWGCVIIGKCMLLIVNPLSIRIGKNYIMVTQSRMNTLYPYHHNTRNMLIVCIITYNVRAWIWLSTPHLN